MLILKSIAFEIDEKVSRVKIETKKRPEIEKFHFQALMRFQPFYDYIPLYIYSANSIHFYTI